MRIKWGTSVGMRESQSPGMLERIFHTASARILDAMIENDGRKEDVLFSVAGLSRLSGVSERGVKRVLPDLIKVGIVEYRGKEERRKVYGLNADSRAVMVLFEELRKIENNERR